MRRTTRSRAVRLDVMLRSGFVAAICILAACSDESPGAQRDAASDGGGDAACGALGQECCFSQDGIPSCMGGPDFGCNYRFAVPGSRCEHCGREEEICCAGLTCADPATMQCFGNEEPG